MWCFTLSIKQIPHQHTGFISTHPKHTPNTPIYYQHASYLDHFVCSKQSIHHQHLQHTTPQRHIRSGHPQHSIQLLYHPCSCCCRLCWSLLLVIIIVIITIIIFDIISTRFLVISMCCCTLTMMLITIDMACTCNKLIMKLLHILFKCCCVKLGEQGSSGALGGLVESLCIEECFVYFECMKCYLYYESLECIEIWILRDLDILKG